MDERFEVTTDRQLVGTGRYRKDENGDKVQIMTSTRTEIKLRDKKHVWPSTHFTDFNFAQKCADALNQMEINNK